MDLLWTALHLSNTYLYLFIYEDKEIQIHPAPFGRQILCHMTLGFRIHLWIYGFIIYYANYADHIYMYMYFYSTSDPPPPHVVFHLK